MSWVEGRIVLSEPHQSVRYDRGGEQPDKPESEGQERPTQPTPPRDEERPAGSEEHGSSGWQNQAARQGLQDEVHGKPTSSSLTRQSRSATESDTASGAVNNGANLQRL